MKKKLCSAAVALLLLTTAVLPAAALDGAGTPAALSLDGVRLDTAAVIQESILYLPLRTVCEALGYTVSWSQEAQTVTAQKGDRLVEFTPEQDTVTDGDQKLYAFPQGGGGGFLNLDGHVYLSAELFDQVFPTAARYDEAGGTVSLRRVEENPILISATSLKAENADLTVSLRFPQLSGLADTQVQRGINALFSQAAGGALKEGLASLRDLIAAELDNPDYTSMCASDLNYRITLNRNNLLGIVLTDYQFAGGAHGGTVQSSYLFDLSTSKVLSLADLMKPDSGYTALIDAAVRAEIDRRIAKGDLWEFEDGKFLTVGDDPACYLTNDAVVFYFQQYEYFPYAAGIQTFSIPYSDLSACLRDEYAFLD